MRFCLKLILRYSLLPRLKSRVSGCSKNNENCLGCQIDKARRNATCEEWETCEQWEANHPEEAVAAVEKWSEENPRKKLKDDFLERYPNAEMSNGVPIVCAKSVYGSSVVNCGSYRSCTDCWNRPLSEEVSDGCN